jgi:hypothetical protein
MSVDCVFTVAVTLSHSGEWTVLPDWDRHNGCYQPTGHEPSLIYF